MSRFLRLLSRSAVALLLVALGVAGTVAWQKRGREPLGAPDPMWAVLLDGLVGAVVAGVVTVIAVRLTIRHERELVTEQQLHEACTGFLGAVTVLHHRMQYVPDEMLWDRPEFIEYVTGLTEVKMRAARKHAEFAAIVQSVGEAYLIRIGGGAGEMTSVYSEAALGDLVTLRRALEIWLREPDQFRTGRTDEAILRRGATYEGYDLSTDPDVEIHEDQSPSAVPLGHRVIRHQLRDGRS